MAYLKDTHPGLRNEWDFEENKKLNFETVRSRSPEKAAWKCKIDPAHRWLALIRDRCDGHGCPYCSGRFTQRKDSFAALHSELFQEFHAEMNPGLDPWAVSPGSSKKVYWKCSLNPTHIWSTRLNARTIRNTGCQQCRIEARSIATKLPDLAKEWHPEKNGERTAENTTIGSTYRAQWRCVENPDHEWILPVVSRVKFNSGCPECAIVSPRPPLGTLAEYSPNLASEWHPTKNGDLTPDQVTAGTHQKVWWQCPVNRDHEWRAAIRNRARLGHGCPDCAGRNGRVATGMSLKELFPELAKQWDYERNHPYRPENFTAGSAKYFWWKCFAEKAHSWKSQIYNRTNKHPNGECPYCKGSLLTEENSLKVVHPDIAAEWHPEKNGDLTASDVSRASGKVVWWLCSKSPAHEWEASVKNRTVHKSGCHRCDELHRSERLQCALIESAQSNSDTFATFNLNLRSLRNLAAGYKGGSVHERQTFWMMLYASAITALETYLSDTFFHRVLGSIEKMEILLATTPEFRERKYSLSEVIDWHQNLQKKVSDYLLSIVWHNLHRVHHMYRDVLNVHFPEDCGAIHRAVMVRHDLVHRNGRTKDGKTHRMDQKHLNKLLQALEEFVNGLQNDLGKESAED